MYLQVFGLSTEPEWWFLSRVPAGGGEHLARLLHERFHRGTALTFYCEQRVLDDYHREELIRLWSGAPAQIVAKPSDAIQVALPETRLRLVTTTGPDAGRIFPLTRRNLSVGRGLARAQIRDPWISGHDFDIRLTSDGPLLAPVGQPQRIWRYHDTFNAGSTRFELLRGAGKPLQRPHDPGPFEITPGQPPSPPNVILQIIGAAAPLLIGIVLMLMTGMWYFLLFSGISGVIAAVLITQYRRARSRYIDEIHQASDATAQRFREAVFTPHEMVLAVAHRSTNTADFQGPEDDHPVINLGSAVRQAEIPHLQDSNRWTRFLSARVTSVLTLRPGNRTIVIGDRATRRPIKNWIIAQLFGHVKLSGTGISVDKQEFGGTPVVELVEEAMPTRTRDKHQIILVTHASVPADAHTTIINLKQRAIEGSYQATDLEPYGVSWSTLRHIFDELRMHQPIERTQLNQLSLSKDVFKDAAVHQLLTALGVGTMGLNIDLVREGPHMLITGTTGSGKSELLLTVLVGLTQRYAPCEVSLILLDFKGGSSFNVLASLPHTMSVETNHVTATSFRSLEAIAAELYRREALFAAHRVPDFEAFRHAFPRHTLPRLVVAIDELRVLVEQNSEAAETLAHLAATGRSLGFHLVMATQRTQGAVSADIRANIGCTIALRTATEHDSWDVLGTAEAFRISPSTPGRAYIKTGADDPRLFQTAAYALDDEPVVLVRHSDPAMKDIVPTTNWSLVVDRLQDWGSNLPLPRPIILPALESIITISELRARFNTEATHTPIGLVDDPRHRSQYPVSLGPTHETAGAIVLAHSVAWIGAPDSGIEESIQVICSYVLSTATRTVLFEGRQLSNPGTGWDQHLHIRSSTSDGLRDLVENIQAQLVQGVPTTIVLTEWGSWAHEHVTGSFQGFEERLIQLMRQFSAILRVYVFGARELAGGRLLAMIPDRFYIPKNSSPEHQLIWPTLRAVPPLTARSVLVTADKDDGGLETQLCVS